MVISTALYIGVSRSSLDSSKVLAFNELRGGNANDREELGITGWWELRE